MEKYMKHENIIPQNPPATPIKTKSLNLALIPRFFHGSPPQLDRPLPPFSYLQLPAISKSLQRYKPPSVLHCRADINK